jgi:hypothetical protein
MDSPEVDPLDAFDNAPWCPPREMLAKREFFPPAIDSLQEAELRGRLWELIYALGALRFFFHQTDHLTDRELYAWIQGWLDEPNAEIPPEAEVNCHVSPSEGDDDAETTTWLRYYADPRERDDWALQFPEFEMPPHEWPPYDRDRFLPCAYPPAAEGDADEPAEDDPLGLVKIDREIRGEVDLLPENWERPADLLQRAGFTAFPPAEITDELLPGLLWEILQELACRGFYVLHTDHLTDRELYSAIWRHALRDEAILPGRTPRAAWVHDFVGSGSEDDHQLWLRFYASDEQRQRDAERYPDQLLPPRETPTCRRDWRLPKSPF